MSDDRIPMTREGYDKKKAELDHLKGTVMIEVTKRVASARDLGDLSENAEYHAAREDQGQLQAKIDLLQSQLNRAFFVEKDSLPKDEVAFGSRVTVFDEDMDEEETFELVGPGQEDPAAGRILTSSPIGQGLIGKKKGETAEIQAPKGVLKFKVLKIEVGSI
jgi:transcription elongation factor GreA